MPECEHFWWECDCPPVQELVELDAPCFVTDDFELGAACDLGDTDCEACQ